MKRVILESPFAGNIERNIAYAKLAVRDCLLRFEAPIASHLLFTQPGLLDDDVPEQRKLGIMAGHMWTGVSDLVAVYEDFGISKGMAQGIDVAKLLGTDIEYRKLPKYLMEELMLKYT